MISSTGTGTGDSSPIASANPTEAASELALQVGDLLAGDILLHRPKQPNLLQRRIMAMTDSPYTHASICLGDNCQAEFVVPTFKVNPIAPLDPATACIAVLRSQQGFDAARAQQLKDFAAAMQDALYNAAGALALPQRSESFFADQLDIITRDYGRYQSLEDFKRQSYFCSSFVVACYSAVGVIDASAQAAYPPGVFSPGQLHRDATFGWLMGYLLPPGGTVAADDPVQHLMQWRNAPECRWWTPP